MKQCTVFSAWSAAAAHMSYTCSSVTYSERLVLAMTNPTMKTALGHVRVLDLSRVLAGPWCSQNLADLGADVIKIDGRGSGDDTRAWGPPYAKDADGNDHTEAAYYLAANRGNRSVTMDIASAEVHALLRELAAHC